MKYLFALLVALSFNAMAITNSHTFDTGVTTSTFTGTTKGVVDHFSKDYSHSVQGNMESEKLDRITGTKKLTTNFGGRSNSTYGAHYMDMNGADFSYKQTHTTYGSEAVTHSKDKFVTDGFERNAKTDALGNSVEHSTYSGDYVTKRREREVNSGTSTTTETSWY